MKNRFSNFEFWDGAVFGAAIASALSIAIGGLFSITSPESWSALATLCSIPAALAAAAAAFHGVRYQINYQRTQDLASARAVLPLTLSQFSGVCRSATKYASGDLRLGAEMDLRNELSLSDVQLSVLRDNIRAADPLTRRWLIILVARYQVYISRLEKWSTTSSLVGSLYGPVSLPHSRESAVLDWATLHAIVDHLFDYSRGVVEVVPNNLDPVGISRSLFSCLERLDFNAAFIERSVAYREIFREGSVESFEISRNI